MSNSDSIIAYADVPVPAFVCSQTNGGRDAAWVHVAGDLDVATTAQLERTLREAAHQTLLVVLDLRELAFMDCAGVHAIVDASIRARQVGHRLVLLRGAPNVDRLFALTGNTDAVEIADVDGRAARSSARAPRRNGANLTTGPAMSRRPDPHAENH